jgi:acetolactate synthase-1/2/3 large subunit
MTHRLHPPTKSTLARIAGLMIRTPNDITPTLKKAFDLSGPVIVGVHVDYRDNTKLFGMVNENSIH